MSGAGRRGLSAYGMSDADRRSISGVSASEVDGDESGDEQAATNTQSAGRSSSRNTPAAPRAPSRQQRPGALNRSESRGRRPSYLTRSSDLPDYLDDSDPNAFGPLDEDDDEVVPYDRGEELVRRRMKARQKEKRKKEKEAEKEKRRTLLLPSGSRPTSPRPRPTSMLPPGQPTSPGHQQVPLDREGRPTFVPLPRQSGSGGEPWLLSPSHMGSASSPGPSFTSVLQGGGNMGGSYPSPHSHIRRPAAGRPSALAATPGAPASGGAGTGAPSNRGRGIGGPQRTPSAQAALPSQDPERSQSRQRDVFFDRPQSIATDSGVSTSSLDEGDEEAEDEGEGDHLANLNVDVEEGKAYAADLRKRAADGQRRREMSTQEISEEGDQDEVAAADEEEEEELEDDEGDETPEGGDSSSSGELGPEDVEYTLKDRQDAINIEHPFGLPIWKPALYKKSRTITRNAENALHSIPSRAAERHFLPGNILWTLIFGVWLSVICGIASILLRLVPFGGSRYARVTLELAGYLFWPFGKYVEVEISPHNIERAAGGDPAGKYNFIDQEGGSAFDDRWQSGEHVECDQQEETYTNEFTPVAARYPHDHQHRVPFNSRASRPSSRDVTLVNPETPGEGPATGCSSGGSSNGEANHTSGTARQPSSSKGGSPETLPLLGKGKGRDGYGATSGGEVDSEGDEEADSADDDATRIERESDLYEYVVDSRGRDVGFGKRWLGSIAYGLVFWLIIAPVLGLICLCCWGLVVTIPMAKLNWVLLKNLATHPLALHFGSAPAAAAALASANGAAHATPSKGQQNTSLDKAKRLLQPLRPGQFASRSKSWGGSPSSRGLRKSKILLCTYRAIGLQYYKYTVGGVNILFVNTLPFVGFTILDFFFLLPYVEKHDMHSGFASWVSGQGVIFVCALGSVIPLSYFIGMAVASISAQSSIGMGAVINATFGSIIEIILYGIALTQEKARLVEGSIIGSILAGVLLMPGLSMCSGATRRKEQRFNARSAGVTSTMLIMAIIGILTPTLFYQIYGTFQLTCTGCPADPAPEVDWTCKRCFYEHVPPATDPFYQENVKGLMYTCTVILVLSYGIGLWFSLRTHASQIWQNPLPAPAPALAATAGQQQQIAGANGPLGNDPLATAGNSVQIPSAQRASVYKRLLPPHLAQAVLPTSQRVASQPTFSANSGHNRLSSAVGRREGSITSQDPPPLRLPESFSQEEYAKAMAFTASAFQTAIRQHQQEQQASGASAGTVQPAPAPAATRRSMQSANQAMPHAQQGHQRETSMAPVEAEDAGGHGGHDAPSWSRVVSLTVLLSCTVLYAIIAEILVDVVDVVLDGSGIDEKFLGITLFALVPNTTEFMNAVSFAINGNIALSMEIGSAYALQVCLIQIPAMVAFSAYYNSPGNTNVGGGHLEHRSFTLIFPRWDVIAIIFSVFLLTYTYIEARSNYYRGSICILSYLVLVAGFFFAPPTGDVEAPGDGAPEDFVGKALVNAVRSGMELDWAQWAGALVGALWTR